MIKIDMEIPQDCSCCPCLLCYDGHYGYCRLEDTVNTSYEKRPRNCPLIVSANDSKWERKEDDVSYWYECSNCGERPLYNAYYESECLSDYCPWCGAKMKVGEE